MIIATMAILICIIAIPAVGITDGLDGDYVNDSSLIEKYGKYPKDTFERFPLLLGVVQKAKPGFSPKNVGVASNQNMIFKTRSGKKFLMMSGCTPSDCAGTGHVVAFDIVDNKAYILAEKKKKDVYITDDYTSYGNPPASIEELLVHHWKNY